MTTTGWICKCPKCGWIGMSTDDNSDCFFTGSDYDDPHCVSCFNNGEGIVVTLIDLEE